MPFAPSNGARLFYEETGRGHPVVFVHEFAGDHRSWEQQVRWFSRAYRCIAYNARGYPPSDVPADDAAYHYTHFADDIAALLRHLNIPKAHVVGLSMGAYATLQFGLRHPAMATALVVAAVGSGSPKAQHAAFAVESEAAAARFEKDGAAGIAPDFGLGATRVQLQNKNPRAWADFVRHVGEHSSIGSAKTLRNYQIKRPSLEDFKFELAALNIPTLLVVGDEDDPCLDTNVFLKRTIVTAGLWVVPKTGHAVNLEEPDAFNRAVQDFFGQVERGTWRPRDPRSISAQVMPVAAKT